MKKPLIPLTAARGLLTAFLLGNSVGCSGDPTSVEPDPTSDGTRYQDVLFAETTITRGVQFGASVPFGGTEPSPLLLDVIEPVGDTQSRRAAIVWIHGGGFIAGSRDGTPLVPLARSFATRGYVGVSISYRLRTLGEREADEVGTIRDAVHDARAAVRWLRAHSEEYRINTARIAIGGGSAGAITSLFVAYDDEFGEGESGNPGYSSDVAAVVDYWGSLLGGREDAMETGEPPLIILHGTLDATVPYAAAQSLADRASEVGVPYELYPLEGHGHSPWNAAGPLEDKVVSFLYQHVIR